jgi:hypothetical protein
MRKKHRQCLIDGSDKNLNYIRMINKKQFQEVKRQFLGFKL